MGRGKTKLVDFEQMVASFQNESSHIKQLEDLQIWNLAPEQVEETKKAIWNLIASLQVGIGETKVVSGSKALHHLLPELVPQ